jgi:hypothetical protein
LSQPLEVLCGELRQSFSEESFLLLVDVKVLDELPNFLKAGKDDILACERVLPKEDLEGSLVFMFFGLEI